MQKFQTLLGCAQRTFARQLPQIHLIKHRRVAPLGMLLRLWGFIHIRLQIVITLSQTSRRGLDMSISSSHRCIHALFRRARTLPPSAQQNIRIGPKRNANIKKYFISQAPPPTKQTFRPSFNSHAQIPSRGITLRNNIIVTDVKFVFRSHSSDNTITVRTPRPHLRP